jgi:hypothetical protein
VEDDVLAQGLHGDTDVEAEMEKVRQGLNRESEPRPLFCDFAVDLCQRKQVNLDVQSASGREKWDNCLGHILGAPFAEKPIDTVTHRDLVLWRDALPTLTYDKPRARKSRTRVLNEATGRMKFQVESAAYVEARHYDSTTLNTWLRVLRVITKAMAAEYDLAKDVGEGLKLFAEDEVFSEENPNALNEDGELAEFLRVFKQKYPQHYAMVLLGLRSGRPSQRGRRAKSWRPCPAPSGRPQLPQRVGRPCVAARRLGTPCT